MVAHAPVEFRSYSQAGQDRLVWEVLGGPRCGTFLDIGANNPIVISNTFGLERMGWNGLLVDNSGESMVACEREREAYFYLTDAAKPQGWLAALAQANLPTDRIDYLSLDIDGATLECLKNLPLDRLRFRVMTVEHDGYRNPPEYRQAIIDILRGHGYDILCEDVCDQGMPFEVWAVDPTTTDPKLTDKFWRSKPTEWRGMFR